MVTKGKGAMGALMKSSILKRSIIIDGHKTSVSLEDAFWSGLRDIAYNQQTTLSKLVSKSTEHASRVISRRQSAYSYSNTSVLGKMVRSSVASHRLNKVGGSNLAGRRCPQGRCSSTLLCYLLLAVVWSEINLPPSANRAAALDVA